jgi:hypothetical protein
MEPRFRAFTLAMAAAGLTAVLAGCGGGASASSPAAGPSPSKSPGNRGDKGVTGQISAEAGTTWTLKTKDGKQVTVSLTPQTQYGTKQEPANQQQFTVGSTVRVNGTVDGDKVTAERITKPAPKTPGSGKPQPTSTPTG